MPANASQPGDAPIDLNILPPEYRPREVPATPVLLAVAVALLLALLGVLGATRPPNGAPTPCRQSDAQRATLQSHPPGQEATSLAAEIRRARETADRLDALRPTTQAGRRDWPRCSPSPTIRPIVAPSRLWQVGTPSPSRAGRPRKTM